MRKLSHNDHVFRSALCLAHASKAAYQNNPRKLKSFMDYGWERVQTFNSSKTETQGFVAADSDNIVVSFRGTEKKIRDWMTDLQYRHHKDSVHGGKVHQGFWNSWKSVRKSVLSKIEDLRDNRQSIWFTGHSLGGALATLSGRDMPSKFQPHAILTFGAPRVGSPTFADKYNRTNHQFVNEDDIVPHLPTRGLITRYRHVGKSYVILADAKISSNAAIWKRLLRKVSRIMIFGLDAMPSKAISDHSMNKYIGKLKKHRLNS